MAAEIGQLALQRVKAPVDFLGRRRKDRLDGAAQRNEQIIELPPEQCAGGL
jgi:hypothetical protein